LEALDATTTPAACSIRLRATGILGFMGDPKIAKWSNCRIRRIGGIEISKQLATIQSDMGSGQYVARCDAYSEINGLLGTHSSNSLTLTVTPDATAINSVSLLPNNVVGGNANTDKGITLTVNLTQPAPVCGQVLYISSDNPNVARVTVSGGRHPIIVPPGQMSTTLSWFLGTKKKNASANVVVDLPKNGGFQKAYAKITVRKN
jgi:hypothetical protein